MALTTKMTKRDKWLLYIMIVVLLLLGWYKLILQPSQTEIDDLDTLIAEAQQAVLEMREDVLLLPVAKAQYDEIALKNSQSLDGLYPLMPGYSVDELITTFILQCGLNPTDFTINEDGAVKNAVPKSVPPYIYSADALEKGETPQDISATQIRITTISVTALDMDGRDRTKIISMLDRLWHEFPSVRVVSYELFDKKLDSSLAVSFGRVAGEELVVPAVTVVCEVYMDLSR